MKKEKKEAKTDHKKELLDKLRHLQKQHKEAEDAAIRRYIHNKILDHLNLISQYKPFTEEELRPNYENIKQIDGYGKIYDYSLAENLNEQVTIIDSNIQAAPMHRKRLELQNTAMINISEEQKK